MRACQCTGVVTYDERGLCADERGPEGLLARKGCGGAVKLEGLATCAACGIELEPAHGRSLCAVCVATGLLRYMALARAEAST